MGLKEYKRNISASEAIQLSFENFHEVIEILDHFYVGHEECAESERVKIDFTNDCSEADSILVTSFYKGDWLIKSNKGFYKTSDANFKLLYRVD